MRVERLTLMTMVLAGAILAAIYWRKASLFREENEKLHEEISQLEQAVSTATNSAGILEREMEQGRNKRTSELMTLRNEVTQLRSANKTAESLNAEVQRLRQENEKLKSPGGVASVNPQDSQAQNRFTRDSWSFSGYNTPENALVSAIWAMKQGNPQAYYQSLTPEEQTRLAESWKGKTEEEIAKQHQSDVSQINGLRILDRHEITPTQMQMDVYLEGQNRMATILMNQNGNEWKYGGVVDPQPAPKAATGK